MKTKKLFSKTFLLLSFCFLISHLTNAQAQFKALLITETAGWHHESIPAGIIAINELAATHNFEVTHQQSAIKITEDILKN